MMGIERGIALRYLRAKRKNSLVSLISVLAVGGVGLGVAALIVVLAVLAGFETNLKNKLLGLSAHVTIYRAGDNIHDWPEVVESIKGVPGVVSAQPFVNGQIMVSTRMGGNGVFMKGLDPKLAREVGFFEPMALSEHGLDNLTQRPMHSSWELEDGQWLSEDETADKGLEAEEAEDETGIEDGSTEDPEDAEGVGSSAASVGEDGDGAEDKEPPEAEVRPLIIGKDLSLILGVDALSPVNVVSPFGRITPLGNRAPLSRVFQVAGTFQTNIYEYDSSVVYTTLGEAQGLLGMDNDVSVIEVMVDNIYQASEIRKAIVLKLGPGEYWGRDWMELNMSLFSALKLEQTAMFVILTLIILVAAFNIASTLIMMVTEKTRDIAILKAMGATSAQIRRIFTLQGLVVGAVGTLGGLVVGVVLCLLLKRYEFISLPPEVYLMSTLPVEMRPFQVVATTVVSLLISYLATLYPSKQAASMDPVEALRYE